MTYQELSREQKQQACQHIWQQLTHKAGSTLITIAWSRMSVEEAITDCTSGELTLTAAGWQLSEADFNSIFHLVEHPPGADELQQEWDSISGNDW